LSKAEGFVETSLKRNRRKLDESVPTRIKTAMANDGQRSTGRIKCGQNNQTTRLNMQCIHCLRTYVFAVHIATVMHV